MLLPFVGGVFSYFLKFGKSHILPTAIIGFGLVGAIRLIFSGPVDIRWSWLPNVELGIHIDQLSSVLISLVYLISLLVHLFSLHYLKGDPGIKRYFFKLGFFTSSMLGLLASDHLLLVFVFWELVGFSSYLLIGFWLADATKAKSAKTAFMVNRVADAGLLIGIILLLTVFEMPFLSEMKFVGSNALIIFTGMMIVIGAFGKSAQFPFFGWLNKAMAGPTPVSALIHAATMVTAGIYLLVRVFPFLTEEVLMLIAFGGAITAFMAGVSALFQNDIKAVLAYSTISQLGYMVLGVGVGAFQFSIFHLWTHAFFKAGLFLAAGSVIHFMHKANHEVDAQDMRNMGGLSRKIPFTFLTFVICGAALAGIPFTSGFLSKEGILGASMDWFHEMFEAGNVLVFMVPFLAFATVLLTPLYITRQILLVFFGKARRQLEPIERSSVEPWLTVKLPFIPLMLGAVWFFSTVNPFGAEEWFLRYFLFGDYEVLRHSSSALFTLVASIVLVGAGIWIGIMRFRPKSNYALSYGNKPDYTKSFVAFLAHGWYIQKAYNTGNKGFLLVTNFAFWLDRNVVDRAVDGVGLLSIVLSKTLGLWDKYIVDGLVNLMATFFQRVGKALTRIQAPAIQAQLMVMLFVLVFLIYWFLF